MQCPQPYFDASNIKKFAKQNVKFESKPSHYVYIFGYRKIANAFDHNRIPHQVQVLFP